MEFIQDPEVLQMTKELLPGDLAFDDVEVNRILCVKEISGKMQYRRIADIKPVNPPFNLLNPNILYILCVYSKYWDHLPVASKKRYIAHQLMHIREFNGRLTPHNVEDFQEVIQQYGYTDPD